MKIIITGGAGFIGSKLTDTLIKDGHSVVIVGPHALAKPIPGAVFVKSDLSAGNIPKDFLDSDIVIHLAGANIFNYWSDGYKKIIFESRVNTAQNIFEYLKQNPEKRPSVFVSASAVGFYGNRGEETLIEDSKPGEDFLAEVCVKWEQAAKDFEKLGMRTVSVRTGIVIGRGGILKTLLPIFKLGLGTKIGTGKQWFPWIYVDDLVHIYKKAALDQKFKGPINAVSPQTITSDQFTTALAKALNRPLFLRIPGFIFKLFLGELSEAILTSEKVIPVKLDQQDFKYKFPKLEEVLKTVVK